MWEEFTTEAQNLAELKQEREETEQKLSELKSDTFGTDSEEAEEKARSFFENVGMGEGAGKTQEIDETKQKLNDIEQKLEEFQEEILRTLTEVQFPFNETIDQRDSSVAFPFTKELPEETIEVINNVVQNDGGTGTVELEREGLVTHTDEVNEAIDEVEEFVNKLRKAAQHELNTEDYAKDLIERDIKIQRMLYELYENDEPLAKKELEMETGVEKGGLRGVLYHVLDDEPYLVKENKKYRLSDIGEDVVEKFLEQFGVPEKPRKDQDDEEDEEGSDNEQESQATLSSTGDSNE
ncbi:hypothetical protein BRD03_10745 [Halobacteriales archaeon QS_9_68_17]|nr:MAG: hypothetical protein BRD03_10745 [Halobacteriales archaeon QS_9_68_17]